MFRGVAKEEETESLRVGGEKEALDLERMLEWKRREAAGDETREEK